MSHLIFFLSKLNKKEILKVCQLVFNSFVAGILEIVSLASLIPVLHVVLKDDQENSKDGLFENLFNYIDSYFPLLNNIIYACLFFIVIFLLKIHSFLFFLEVM